MMENISRITFSAKYTCMMDQHTMANITQKLKKTGIFYNGEGLRVYCYHFCYPACQFLVLQVAIIPQILVFLHFSQCRLIFLSLYMVFFSLLIDFFFLFNYNCSNLATWSRCKWYCKFLVLKFLAVISPQLIDSPQVMHRVFLSSFGSISKYYQIKLLFLDILIHQ